MGQDNPFLKAMEAPIDGASLNSMGEMQSPPDSSNNPFLKAMGDNSQPVMAAPPPKASSSTDAVVRGLANGIPFMPEIAAAGDAAASYLPQSVKNYFPGYDPKNDLTGTFGERFNKDVANQKGLDTANATQYPITSTVAPLAGALAALPVAGPVDAVSAGVARVAPRLTGLAADSLASGAVGAGYGALYGAGTGDTLQERLSNAKENAGVGLVGGAVAPGVSKLIGNVGRGLLSKIGLANPEADATRQISAAIDPAKTMPTADIAAAQSAQQPLVAADILGPQNVGRLAEKAAVASPQAESILRGVAEPRFESQGDRTQTFLQNLFGTNLNAADMVSDLTTKAQTANGANYRSAMGSPQAQAVWNKGLENLIQSPDVQDAISNASRVAKQEAVAERSLAMAHGQSVPDGPIVSNPFVKDENGMLTLGKNPDGSQAIPSLKFWDIVKRNLDTQYDKSLGNFNRPTNDSRLIENTKNALVANLDAQVPEYADARAGAAGFFGEKNAFDAGLKYLGKRDALSSSKADAALNALTPSQKELFAQGLATDIAQKAITPNVRRNVLQQFNSPATKGKIIKALGPYAPQIESYLRVENTMDGLRTALGNSRTAHRLTDTAPYGHGILGIFSQYLGTPVTGAVAGGWGAYETGQNIAGGATLGAIGGLTAQRGAAYNKAVAESLARLLTESDPEKIASVASMIGQSPHLLQSLRGLDNAIMLTAPVVKTTGTNRPIPYQPTIPASQGQQTPQLQTYASGGKVTSPEFEANRLIREVDKARKFHSVKTKPLLNVADEAITRALATANQHI